MKGNMEIDGEQCRVLAGDECWREDRKEKRADGSSFICMFGVIVQHLVVQYSVHVTFLHIHQCSNC